MDQGIISWFKRNSRKEVVKNIIVCMDVANGFSNNSSTSKIIGSILILTAVQVMNKSRNNISFKAIKNCFIKCNLSTDINNGELDDE